MIWRSEHFTLAELTRTDHPYDNTPRAEHVEALHALAVCLLDPIRRAYGAPVHVNSGFRSPTVNAAVKGSATSDHMQGRAADIAPYPAPSGRRTVAVLWNALYPLLPHLTFDQVILYPASERGDDLGFLHVSLRVVNSHPETARAGAPSAPSVAPASARNRRAVLLHAPGLGERYTALPDAGRDLRNVGDVARAFLSLGSYRGF